MMVVDVVCFRLRSSMRSAYDGGRCSVFPTQIFDEVSL